jgi:hypothetical protein
MLAPVTRLGEEAHLTIVDAAEYAEVGERVSFWELAERAQEMRDVLLGYYVIPEHPDEPLESIIDPIGNKVGEAVVVVVWEGVLLGVCVGGGGGAEVGWSAGAVLSVKREPGEESLKCGAAGEPMPA